MSSVPCSNWIRSVDAFGIALADILPANREHWVDGLPSFRLASRGQLQ